MHWGAGLVRYGWLRHDGTRFGRQELVDGGVQLTTSFVRPLMASVFLELCPRFRESMPRVCCASMTAQAWGS